jgi:hypothetical protein
MRTQPNAAPIVTALTVAFKDMVGMNAVLFHDAGAACTQGRERVRGN